jgi:hypothetical protein
LNIIKIQIPGKIYWNCFTRQIKELYFLLQSEGCINCGLDEFLKHFTGKKITDLGKPGGKIKWLKDNQLLSVLASHLTEKGFLDGTSEENVKILLEHFIGNDKPAIINFETVEKSIETGKFQLKLEALFPATSGYRCKTRLFYKARNKQPQKSVLEKLGIV